MHIETMPGAAGANSYATGAEFDTYAENRIPAVTWFATATGEEKEFALVCAARMLDACFKWTGSAVDATQALTWPRKSMRTRNGFSIPTSGTLSITQPLKDAQCELALQMGAGDLFSDNEAAKKGVASVKAGSVAVSFFQNQNISSIEAMDIWIRLKGSEFLYISDLIPQAVRALLVPSWYEQPTMTREFIFGAM